MLSFNNNSVRLHTFPVILSLLQWPEEGHIHILLFFFLAAAFPKNILIFKFKLELIQWSVLSTGHNGGLKQGKLDRKMPLLWRQKPRRKDNFHDLSTFWGQCKMQWWGWIISTVYLPFLKLNTPLLTWAGSVLKSGFIVFAKLCEPGKCFFFFFKFCSY